MGDWRSWYNEERYKITGNWWRWHNEERYNITGNWRRWHNKERYKVMGDWRRWHKEKCYKLLGDWRGWHKEERNKVTGDWRRWHKQKLHDFWYLLIYLLTPWCRVLLEKLTGLHLVKKFPAFHGTRRFITALTSVRHLSLSWASPIQSIYPHPTSWRSILILSTHLCLGLPSGLLPCGFPSKWFVVLLNKHYSGDKIKETQMGAARGIYELEERCTQGFVEKTWGQVTSKKT